MRFWIPLAICVLIAICIAVMPPALKCSGKNISISNVLLAGCQ